jgi:hypothetical protein
MKKESVTKETIISSFQQYRKEFDSIIGYFNGFGYGDIDPDYVGEISLEIDQYWCIKDGWLVLSDEKKWIDNSGDCLLFKLTDHGAEAYGLTALVGAYCKSMRGHISPLDKGTMFILDNEKRVMDTDIAKIKLFMSL